MCRVFTKDFVLHIDGDIQFFLSRSGSKCIGLAGQTVCCSDPTQPCSRRAVMDDSWTQERGWSSTFLSWTLTSAVHIICAWCMTSLKFLQPSQTVKRILNCAYLNRQQPRSGLRAIFANTCFRPCFPEVLDLIFP